MAILMKQAKLEAERTLRDLEADLTTYRKLLASAQADALIRARSEVKEEIEASLLQAAESEKKYRYILAKMEYLIDGQEGIEHLREDRKVNSTYWETRE